MSLKQILSVIVVLGFVVTGAYAQTAEQELPFAEYPETTDLGEFLCKLTFARGLPPCFKESVWHWGYAYYPTRIKARNIVETYTDYGLYSRELLTSFFGCLITGSYRPVDTVPVGDYWDSAYFALVKLDQRLVAKKLLMDIVFDRDWAQGRFPNQRYKALQALARERIITLREYQPLVDYLNAEMAKDNPDPEWTRTLIYALSSFLEWGDELLPLFRQSLEKSNPVYTSTVLKTFIDFQSRDDGAFILDQVFNSNIPDLTDQKKAIRAAYVLDDEYVGKKLTEYLKETHENLNPELKKYMEETIARINWFGNWEIMDTKETVDAGLQGEKIAFKMVPTLEPSDDTVNFSLIMQISDYIDLKPIGSDDAYETNNVSFSVTNDTLILTIDFPIQHESHTKTFTIKEGKGREKGQIYLQFPVPADPDSNEKPKTGWIRIEKIS